jgi:hypothetical protein
MTLVQSVLLVLIGLALLSMLVTAVARDHQRFKHAYQEFNSNGYPAFVCDDDGDDCSLYLGWGLTRTTKRMNASTTRSLSEAGLLPGI